ncbi:MAG: nucleotidyltransferase family protein [Candidatus Rokubacteria bacterium]|nr:nucleotidyltransferase family protein [Candidatus Rokubacteria bacterium]
MIAGIVLAAGLSRRMGQAKLFLDWGGRPLIRRTVERVASSGLDDILVVVGPAPSDIEAALEGLGARLVVNAHPEAGQAGSIEAGIRALVPGTAAALVALGDQPTVPGEVIPALLRAFRESGRPVAAPRYRGARGNPVLFSAALFSELLALGGDQGGRCVVDRDPARVTLVDFDLPMPEDLDTPGDYERLRPSAPPV